MIPTVVTALRWVARRAQAEALLEILEGDAVDSYLQGTGGQAESGAASVGGDGSMPMWLAATPSGKLAYTVDMSGEGSVHAHHIAASGALTPINVQPSLGAGP